MREILVLGGGGHAKVVISILKKSGNYAVIGYTDLQDRGTIQGVPYVGPDADGLRREPKHAVIAVGQVGLGRQREGIWRKIQSDGISFPPIASKHACINEGVDLGEGTVVMDGVVINPDAVTGTGAIINTGSIVEHDCIVGDWVHIAPGAVISGGTRIGNYTMIGAGAVVIEGLTIAAECIIGAGATVISNITEPGVYVGSPARRIR